MDDPLDALGNKPQPGVTTGSIGASDSTGDPRKILAEAGVECAEVDAYRHECEVLKAHALPPHAVTMAMADAVILALARLVAKYKWQRDEVTIEWLKALRCEGCQHAEHMGTTRSHLVPNTRVGVYSCSLGVTAGEWGDSLPEDFACNRWTEQKRDA